MYTHTHHVLKLKVVVLTVHLSSSPRALDRKPFAWRELRSVFTSSVNQMPKDTGLPYGTASR